MHEEADRHGDVPWLTVPSSGGAADAVNRARRRPAHARLETVGRDIRLYQLAIYAVATYERTAVMLYPTEDHAAREERIELVDPARTGPSATVVLRLVHLDRIVELLRTGFMERTQRQAAAGFAATLVRCVNEQVPGLRAA
jgi:hypothetical protein